MSEGEGGFLSPPPPHPVALAEPQGRAQPPSMEVEGFVADLTDGIPAEVLAAVTQALRTWTAPTAPLPTTTMGERGCNISGEDLITFGRI